MLRPASSRVAPVARVRSARAPLSVGVLAAAATVVVGIVDPHRPGHYLVCPVYALTGMYCPGCGALRATYDVLHGNLAGAWALNPLWVMVAPVLVVGWLRWLARTWRATPPEDAAGPRVWLAWACLAVVVGFGVARNIPGLSTWLAR